MLAKKRRKSILANLLMDNKDLTQKEYDKLPEKEKKKYEWQLYDEKFEHGGYEDICLFLRVKQAGKRMLMTPKMIYFHEEGATRFSEQENGTQSDAEPKNREYFKKNN